MLFFFGETNDRAFTKVVGKGASTKDEILRRGLLVAGERGLEGLTIGTLAASVGMSKSGLYAHFGSKEDLQIAVLDHAAGRFRERVVIPAIRQPRGLPRLQELFRRWLAWPADLSGGGCPFIGGATEFDDREGPVRDALAQHLTDILSVIERATRICIEEGHMRADTDPGQIAYEVWGLVLGYHHFSRFARSSASLSRAETAFTHLLEYAGSGGRGLLSKEK